MFLGHLLNSVTISSAPRCLFKPCTCLEVVYVVAPRDLKGIVEHLLCSSSIEVILLDYCLGPVRYTVLTINPLPHTFVHLEVTS